MLSEQTFGFLCNSFDLSNAISDHWIRGFVVSFLISLAPAISSHLFHPDFIFEIIHR